MNLRGPQAGNPPSERRTEKIKYDTSSTNNNGLPGLHNPSGSKFHQDAGKPVSDEYFFNKTFRKPAKVARSSDHNNIDNVPLQEIVMQHNQNLYGNKDDAEKPDCFIKRQAIRETWAKDHSSKVLFVVAQSDCAEFEHDLGPVAAPSLVTSNDNVGAKETQPAAAAAASTTTSNATNSTPSKCNEIDHNFLRLEQEKYEDLLEIPMKEKYTRLPEKLLQAYHWVLKNVPNVEWIVKSDDDMFVRVANLEQYLKKYNSNIPMVIGEIIYHSQVSRGGKWAELEYPYEHYPFWPKGSAGHVMSRAAAKYLSDMSGSLHRYQGEDTSIGIWLDQARQNKVLDDVTYIHAKNMFESHGKQACARPKYMIIGHDFRPDELLECYQNYTHNFTESAWLDDPSEFDEIIRQEAGSNSAIAMEWRPAIGYKKDTQELANHVSSTSFGYKGTPIEKT
ncbi:MAG: hypothetical protein SGILL_009783 [Bacillariaceae sp.]